MGKREYPCDGEFGCCPFNDERGIMSGNCRDNCGLGVDEDYDPAEDINEEVTSCGE